MTAFFKFHGQCIYAMLQFVMLLQIVIPTIRDGFASQSSQEKKSQFGSSQGGLQLYNCHNKAYSHIYIYTIYI